MRYFVLIICMALCGISCEKVLIREEASGDPIENFESMWHTLDEKYSYFELKNIDWDSVYREYRPQVRPDMNEVELFDLLAEMLFILRDGHVNLVTPFDLSRNWQWYLQSPENFDYALLERNYLKEDYRITGPFRHRLIDSMGYIYYGSFSSNFSSAQLDLLMETYEDARGLIIDIRNNGGGKLSNAHDLDARFLEKERTVYCEAYKDGPGHEDFTACIPQLLSPPQQYTYDKKVVLLTNRSSYSAANTFTVIMSQLDLVHHMGDTTGGGGGLPVDYELPNGWRYRFSATRTRLPNGMPTELGIPPDTVVYLKAEDEIEGEDTMLEAALDFFD